MRYKVIHFFTDLQDFNHPYHVGDTFPRSGLLVSEERIKELSGSQNKQHQPLIAAEPEEETEELPFSDPLKKSDILRMNKAELQKMAAEAGVEGVQDMTAAELKETMISLLGL